ncbi:hypothetical protein B0T17DRAFT_317853 [Bombardia bombarda]|uniref:Uncharacterized protein n=1 Tax=Bombardia bombarda TaxID=252184 RepID=A0AA39WM56_9PEZI|nr:hypothetical protein B0T17DRAFT_317853 [Bombardia bombarda]
MIWEKGGVGVAWLFGLFVRFCAGLDCWLLCGRSRLCIYLLFNDIPPHHTPTVDCAGDLWDKLGLVLVHPVGTAIPMFSS